MRNQPIVPEGVHYVPHPSAAQPKRWYIYAWRNGGPLVAKIDSEPKPQLARDVVKKIEELITLRDNAERDDLDPADEATPLSWLIRKWRSDPDWKQLAKGTKRTWGYELDRILERWGLAPLILFYDERMVSEIYQWRDSRKDTPRPADIGITVMRRLLKFGAPLVGSSVDITRTIPPLDAANSRPDIIWTNDEIDRFIEVALAQGKPELVRVIRLAALTGTRRGDLTTVCKAHVREHEILKTARKIVKGRAGLIAIPTFSRLAALLLELRNVRRAKNVRTLLVNASGRPWNDDHLSHEFGAIAKLANIVHLDRDTPTRKPKRIPKTLHDVRGTFATKLMTEALLSDPEIADVMGWAETKVRNIRRAYVDDKARMQALAARIRRSPR